MKREPFLILAGALSLLAALVHLAVIVGGPDWYRFFGAGEELARMAERGSIYPALLTLGIATILAIWAAYAFSGAGLIGKLPLLRTGLVVITTIYLLRGLILVPAVVLGRDINAFGWWSSLIVLGYGLAYLIGTWRAWPRLAR
ncbi:MAG: hypothetical protein J0L52_06990 [Caulobacterales bacterium]|nr:hypothetical protein [Caulobacterales bacterium]